MSGKTSAEARRRYDATPKGRATAKRAREAHYQRRKAMVAEIKAAAGCRRCGFDDPRALDFHHTDPTTKRFNLSSSNLTNKTVQKILDEIAKCDVLCANCHRIEHAEEGCNGR